MKLFLTKLSVVLITFMTFGVFIPPTYLDAEASEREAFVSNTEEQIAHTLCDTVELHQDDDDVHDQIASITAEEHFVSYMSQKAKEQSLQKFGPKIAYQVEDEFLTVILPKIEEVISKIAKETDEMKLVRFEITECPSSGYGEKIFHIIDGMTKKDVARFHVKRVNHPSIGHAFNFHYHLHNDNFEQHYHIGDIYWDKNTPPKWMT